TILALTRAARARAIVKPAGPAPITQTSASKPTISSVRASTSMARAQDTRRPLHGLVKRESSNVDFARCDLSACCTVSGASAVVSVIIPTLVRPARVPGLIRAIDSVISQQGARGLPIVVINGSSAAAELRDRLARRHDLRIITLG